MDAVESREFREEARKNGYEYGPLFVYSDRYVSLDEHAFPSYVSKSGTGAVEKFLSLVQSLSLQYHGNDPADKLSKPLPGVNWSDDKLNISLSLGGVMYFTDFNDYKACKRNIRKDLVTQGWEQYVSRNDTLNMSVTTYRPTRHGEDSLYNDDPVDAAGMAMMTSAMQHVNDQVKMIRGASGGDADMYAEGYARYEAMATSSGTLSSLGFLGDSLMSGIHAMGANFNSGIVGKWQWAGHPLRLKIGGQVQAQGLNFVMTSLRLTEKAFVVDKSSDGYVYPTAMDVDVGLTNMYGTLFNTSKEGKPNG